MISPCKSRSSRADVEQAQADLVALKSSASSVQETRGPRGHGAFSPASQISKKIARRSEKEPVPTGNSSSTRQKRRLIGPISALAASYLRIDDGLSTPPREDEVGSQRADGSLRRPQERTVLPLRKEFNSTYHANVESLGATRGNPVPSDVWSSPAWISILRTVLWLVNNTLHVPWSCPPEPPRTS